MSEKKEDLQLEEANPIYDKLFPVSIDNMDEILGSIERIFNKYKIEDIFMVLNALVIENGAMNFKDPKRISPKIINRLFYIYERNLSENKNNTINFNQIKESLRSHVIEAMNLIIKTSLVVHDTYQQENSVNFKNNPNFLIQTYLNYFFDYPDITKPQYIHAILCNKDAIEKIYNNRITVEEILKGVIICIYFELYKSSILDIPRELYDKYKYGDIFTSFPIEKLKNRLKYYNVRDVFIDIFLRRLMLINHLILDILQVRLKVRISI